ncbi:VOC family protein [Peribacillus frigoritolerans]|uniref:VOC family protein n=1 Tax=Peribacillus frigoritolerans TaxID=450367 RepID=UPI0024C139CD|nr:VOC family protein [Peribacillus frigoritolerans]WHX64938.1 VOC family protein [Peribacillus frigoritolerans]
MKIASSPINSKINNVFIHVKDLKKSVEWYCNLLGISRNNDSVESPVYNIPVTSETGLTLDDHTLDPNFIFKPSNNVLFNFYAKDIDEAYQFIKSNNIAIVKEIERIGSFAYFNSQDPDGNVRMICNG